MSVDDREQQRMFKSFVAQLTELCDNLPDGLRPDLHSPEGQKALAKTLTHDEEGNVAFGTSTHWYYRTWDGRACRLPREPGPRGYDAVEYKAGVEVDRYPVPKPPELN
jgi:hypothetical protein